MSDQPSLFSDDARRLQDFSRGVVLGQHTVERCGLGGFRTVLFFAHGRRVLGSVVRVLVGGRVESLDFGNGAHGQVSAEQQKQREEQTEAAR